MKPTSPTVTRRSLGDLKTRRFRTALAAVAVAALLIRLGACWELVRADPQVSRPSKSTDMATYMNLAARVAEGEFEGPFYYQPFYYAVFLPLIRLLFGVGPWPVMLAQSLLAAFTVYLTGLTGGLLAGRKGALTAAALTAFSGIFILYAPYHLIAASQAFWVVLIVYLALRAASSNRLSLWGALGGALACAILTRGNLWFFVPGALVIAWRAGTRRSRRDAASTFKERVTSLNAWGPLLVLSAMIVLPQVPFAVWNTVAAGRLSGPSTAAGAVLALGNTPEAPPGGRDPGAGPGPMEYPETYSIWTRGQDEASVPAQIVKWFWREPLAFCELYFRKGLLFWDRREIPNNIAVEHQGTKSACWRVFGFVSTGLLVTLALAGAITALPTSKRRFWICLHFMAAYWLATITFYNLARFRVPIIPLLAVMGGLFVARLAIAWRRRDGHFITRKLAPALCLGAFVSYGAYDLYRFNVESVVTRWVRPDGVRVERSDGGVVILDHGPRTFGSWRGIPITSGASLRKRFVPPLAMMDQPSAIFRAPLFWATPGEAEVVVNGRGPVTLSANEPGRRDLSITLPFPEASECVVKFHSVTGELYVMADFQRNYGRTALNGETIPCEWVARLEIGK